MFQEKQTLPIGFCSFFLNKSYLVDRLSDCALFGRKLYINCPKPMKQLAFVHPSIIAKAVRRVDSVA